MEVTLDELQQALDDAVTQNKKARTTQDNLILEAGLVHVVLHLLVFRAGLNPDSRHTQFLDLLQKRGGYLLQIDDVRMMDLVVLVRGGRTLGGVTMLTDVVVGDGREARSRTVETPSNTSSFYSKHTNLMGLWAGEALGR